VDEQTRKGDTNMFTETRELILFTNVPAMRKALAYCRAAIRELEEMKLAPALDAERIEALKKEIPNADEITQFTGEKPLSKVNTDRLSMLPSDSESDWRFKKVMEKAKKVLRK
jgi:hypothetical protein